MLRFVNIIGCVMHFCNRGAVVGIGRKWSFVSGAFFYASLPKSMCFPLITMLYTLDVKLTGYQDFPIRTLFGCAGHCTIAHSGVILLCFFAQEGFEEFHSQFLHQGQFASYSYNHVAECPFCVGELVSSVRYGRYYSCLAGRFSREKVISSVMRNGLDL